MKLNESVLEKETLSEAGAGAAAAAALGSGVKSGLKYGILAKLLGGGEDGDDIADAMAAEFRGDPLDIESPQLSDILNDIKKILNGINASIAMLPKDPEAISAAGDPSVPGDVDVTRGPTGREKNPETLKSIASLVQKSSNTTSSSKQKPRKYKVVTELKNKVIENLRSLL